MKKIQLFLLILIFSGLQVFAQNAKERKEITDHYDLVKIENLRQKYQKEATQNKLEAIKKAKVMGWLIKGSENGNAFELMRLTPDGKPIYYQTQNLYSAKTIRTDQLYSGGSLGLNLQGQNMIVGVWDGGPVRKTHSLLGDARVTQRDGVVFTTANDYNRHATHVTGTMIADGQLRYRGMAFNAHAWASDWNNDDAEMIDAAGDGLLVSNHSYGIGAFNDFGVRQIDLYWFGKYSQDAHNWDEIMFNAPYYLIVDAAGNDRRYAANGTNKGGYDMLTGNSMVKNGITVAAVNRLLNYSSPSSVIMSDFSNWGPVDDGRIKPDISSQGVDVSSCVSDSDSAIDSYDGTSMAAPSVTGSLILLQQHYKESYGNFLRSATLKGLALHTADEAGSHPGPDFAFGWGLMNTAKAATTISDNGLNSIVREITLNQGDTYTFTIDADGTIPLMASICWTDPAGNVITGSAAYMLDNPAVCLINDLDIRIIKNSTTYFPWKLSLANPSAAATKGDNIVDNFEKVQVDSANGTYTIQISHKGTLVNGKQNVSVIVTGITNPIAINTKNGEYVPVCVDSNPNLNIDLHFSKNSSVSGSTVFSVSGLPSGVSANFTPSSLSSNGDFTLALSNLNNASAGLYDIEVVGTNGSTTRSKVIQLHILRTTFSQVNLISPANSVENVRIPVTLKWAENENAQEYEVQVAYNADFSTNFGTYNTTATSMRIVNNMNDGTTYYWRVKPKNNCGNGDWSTVYSFKTLVVNCTQGYNTTAVALPAESSSPTISTLNVPSNETISNLKVYFNINHSKVSDLEVKLQSPSNTEVVILQNNTCSGSYSDIDATFYDAAEDMVECNSSGTAILGDYKPFESMGAFVGEGAHGDWKLKILDNTAGNSGTLNYWVMEICEEVVGVNDDKINLFKVWPNPSTGQINIQLEAGRMIDVKVLDILGKQVFHKSYNNSGSVFTKSIYLGNLKRGVYFIQVNSNNKSGIKKIIVE